MLAMMYLYQTGVALLGDYFFTWLRAELNMIVIVHFWVHRFREKSDQSLSHLSLDQSTTHNNTMLQESNSTQHIAPYFATEEIPELTRLFSILFCRNSMPCKR